MQHDAGHQQVILSDMHHIVQLRIEDAHLRAVKRV